MANEPRLIPYSNESSVDTLVMVKFIPVLIVLGIGFLIYMRCCMSDRTQRQRDCANLIEAIWWYCLWLVMAPLMIFYIKDLLTREELQFGYSFGFLGWSNFITWAIAHLIIQFATLTNCKASFGLGSADTTLSWSKGHMLGILQALEVGLSARILREVSVTVKTEVHMLCPLFQYIGGVAFGLEPFRLRLVLSIMVLAFGACLVMQGDFSLYDSNSGGYIMVLVAMGSSIFTVLRWTLVQYWLAPKQFAMRPSALILLCKMSPATAVCGLIVAAFTEPDMYSNLSSLPYPIDVLLHLIVIGTFVVVMISAESRAVQLTSALTLSVITPLHNMSVILMDQIMGTGSPISNVAWAGIAITSLATTAYAGIRHQAKNRIVVECNQNFLDHEHMLWSPGRQVKQILSKPPQGRQPLIVAVGAS